VQGGFLEEETYEIAHKSCFILHLKHFLYFSAAIVYSTLKLLQDSKLFKKKTAQDDTESSSSSGTSVCINFPFIYP
jgi:hypothetical protein